MALCLIAATLLLIGTASAAAPQAAFSSDTTSGAAPLTVEFTDASAGGPDGWAWFFGDETYNGTWTEANGSAGWSAYDHTSVVLPNGSIILMGGSGNADVWRSADNGITWDRIATTPFGGLGRQGHTSVVMPNGSIILMGGKNSWPDVYRDVRQSTDGGATWTRVINNAPWSARYDHTSVVMPNGSIILMGGSNSDGSGLNDVWQSDNYGATWTQLPDAPWGARYDHSSVVLPDGSIVLMGRNGDNDVWRSDNYGVTWTRVAEHAEWSNRQGHTSVAMPDGSIVLMGGYDNNPRNDVWRSTDNGTTWTQVTEHAGWPARHHHTSVAMPDGSIVIMGGLGGTNEVWRLETAGSNTRNPTHTYTEPGTYPVALQAFNADGYSATRQIGYITVTAAPVAPTANFTGTPTSGTAPLAVQFNDTSTGSPTVWNWSFGDGAWHNTTDAAARNATHTYAAAGTYTVSLTASNAGGSDTHTETDYITVSAAPTPTATPTSRPVYSGGGGGGGSTAGPDGGYNVGGDSAVSKVTVTGTGLKTFIVTGRTQSSPGAGIPPAPGTPYQYVDLVPARFEEITGANITFSVPAAWLEEHGFTPGEIVMYHYNGTAWEALPTWVVDDSGSTVTFTATTPGFSLFAISGVEKAGEAITTPTATTPPATAEPTATETTAAPASGTAPEFPLGTVALVGGAILVLAGAGYLVRRWWIIRQNPALFQKYN
ncbi:PGF-pre-PGF domain-containing protein [Methanoculleus sp. Afa-1]|uniref:PGF-pre-PGF domain-containing protein n=1 Tax=Methanoculleus formosensis TaxID=2590886 RepID=A0A9E5DD20_9EURY|nr:kelch repeat-containing protein [Methanoculleus sp. Afa-1]MCT8336808.1 PGF-pre-PGF domain-containing protein [Methanoculleus sp. Afa-1]